MVYVYLAPGFEEAEALLPMDLLIRAGIDVCSVAVESDTVVTGSHGLSLTADVSPRALTELPDDAEMLVLPGGMPGTSNLQKSPLVQAHLAEAIRRGLPLAAICAAPSVLGQIGVLKGKRATCFPGFEDALIGAEVCDCGVVTDSNVITARALGSAHEFAFAIIRLLKDDETAEKVRTSVFYQA